MSSHLNNTLLKTLNHKEVWKVITNKAVVRITGYLAILALALSGSITFAMGALPKPNYHNPILALENLADPHMIRHQGTYYLYGTYLNGDIDGGSDHYDVYMSEDMENWTKGPTILSMDTSELWAPDVYYDQERGKFYLYYSLEMSIGIAISDSPIGPFADQGILVENAIDAHMFHDNGNYYLYYASVEIDNVLDVLVNFVAGIFTNGEKKSKENIYVQRMQSPSEKIGKPVLLLEPGIAWEKGFLLDVNEGPWMFKNGSTYYLMYSGNEAYFVNYAIGYATSDNPMGPFVKSFFNPLVKATKPDIFGNTVNAPGHHSVTKDDAGRNWIVYHQKRDALHFGFSGRYVCRDELTVGEFGELNVLPTPMRDF